MTVTVLETTHTVTIQDPNGVQVVSVGIVGPQGPATPFPKGTLAARPAVPTGGDGEMYYATDVNQLAIYND